MDTVKSFNGELSSLYDMKPPISKAKMTAITKGAIKAVKFYKHIVQSVEKFLQKCRPEYKIPGLYVIDSIVRQSRHQFGPEKDVFAPRFAKNITYTFYYIYQCTAEEKSKVIRVLNLWQKNAVFPPEVIQPLFDMADVSHPKYKEISQFINSRGSSSSGVPMSRTSQDNSVNINGNNDAPISFDDASNDGSQSQSLVMGNLPSLSSTEMSLATRLQHLQHLFGGEPPNNASAAPAQSATPAKQPASTDTGQIRFNKKLLDFDYDEEDDEAEKNRDAGQQQQQPKAPPPGQTAPPASAPPNNSGDTLGNLLINPDILRHLQSLQQQMSQPPANPPAPPANSNHHAPPKEEGSRWDTGPAQHSYSQVDYTQPPPGFIPMGAAHPLAGPPVGFHPGAVPPPGHFAPQQPPPQAPQHHHGQPTIREDLFPPGHNGDVVEIEPPRSKERDRRRSRSGSRGRRVRSRDRHRRSRSRSRSRSRERGGRARRSRSRSRNRNARRGRTRSRDREDREKERVEREKERDRKRRGLPAVKKESLSVCSTTLWVGHLSKLVTQEELSDTFGQYGEIVSIDVIPPRGCAFVCMHRRQDAHRALTKLAGHKLQGKAITLAWAPGKGVKAKEWKDYWEVDQGVSYVPWSRLNPMTDMGALEEGGSFDEETLPPWMKQANSAEMPEAMQAIPMAPAGFIPVPPAQSGSTVDPGPPTPEMGEQVLAAPGPPTLNATTTLPANLPTYAALSGPLGLLPMPLGMPAGLRLPPPPGAGGLLPGQQQAMANAAMATHLLGQSILAGLGAAAAQGLGPPTGAAPPGFFNVFNPHVQAHLAPQEPQVVPSMVPAANNTSGGDDMDLDDGDDSSQAKDDGRRSGWNEPDGHQHTPEASKPNSLPNLLERLRSLANHESAGPVDLHPHGHPNGADDRHEPTLFGMSPGLASSLRGAPLTAAGNDIGVRMLHPGGNGPDGFGTPGRGLGDDRFGPRHLGGFGQAPDNYGPMRGRHFGLEGGRRFRNEMGEPSWDEETPHGPPPPRWRGQEDWGVTGDREQPGHAGRHWDRERDRGGNRADWSSGPSPRRPPLPPLPPRNERGGRGDRFGDRGERGRDRGRDRRRSRSRDRDRRERRSGRWSNRSPDKSEGESSSAAAADQSEQAAKSSEAPAEEATSAPVESASPERSRAKTPPLPPPCEPEEPVSEPKEEEPGPPGSGPSD